jgi:hypothetical protein
MLSRWSQSNPQMCNIRYNPTVVIDASDSQLHQDYTMDLEKISLLKSRMKLLEIATKAFF